VARRVSRTKSIVITSSSTHTIVVVVVVFVVQDDEPEFFFDLVLGLAFFTKSGDMIIAMIDRLLVSSSPKTSSR